MSSAKVVQLNMCRFFNIFHFCFDGGLKKTIDGIDAVFAANAKYSPHATLVLFFTSS